MGGQTLFSLKPCPGNISGDPGHLLEESQLLKLYQELHWNVPLVFSSMLLPQALTVYTDGRRMGPPL